jgi:redox-sensitive bicupin YhaK (pirin superfamily)
MEPRHPDQGRYAREDSRNVELVIAGRPRDLGGFTVRRVLPSIQRRMVGPFIFFDHMGPATFADGKGIAVRPHPHVNLATVTYLFDGEVHHRDSVGSDQIIRPGDVNWMTAGRGIVHSERAATHEGLRRLDGIQLWVALPREHEETEPAFSHHPRAALPRVREGGATVSLIAGTGFGLVSPVVTFSPMIYADIELEAGAAVTIEPEHPERAVYVAHGTVTIDGQPYEAGMMLILRPGARVTVAGASAGATVGASVAAPQSRVMLIGGAPLEGERHIEWNFVSSSLERIERAKREWREGKFPKVPGDELEFIPLPE